jgi:hypothetical protein
MRTPALTRGTVGIALLTYPMTAADPRASRRVREKRSRWWLDHAQRNPIAVLTASALTCGGLILMGFFLRIEFMPDVDLAGSTGLLLASALVGLGTLAAAAFVLAIPGLTTRYMLDEAGLQHGVRAFSVLLSPAVLGTAFIVVQAVFLPTNPLVGKEYAVPFILFAVAVAALSGAALLPEAESTGVSTTAGHYANKAWLLFTGGIVWLIGVLAAMSIALKLAAESAHDSVLVLGLLVLWMLFVIFANILTALVPTRRAWIAGPVVGLFSLLILVLMTGSFSTFSATTVRALGFGELANVDILVKSEVCQALRLSAASRLRCDGGLNGADGILRNVALRSRIGSQVLVEELNNGRAIARSGRLVLRKDDVVLWVSRGSPPK